MTATISLKQRLIRRLPDPVYIYLWHYQHHKELLHIRNPRKFAEKIQWLKVNGGLAKYAQYADKYTVRPYVEEKIGADHLIKLLGVWDSFDEVPFDRLPDKFVLKASHGCGYNFICRDKSKLDIAACRALFDVWMNENFYEQEREPQYRDCKPRIVAEEYMEDASGELTDYKIWCSGGEPKVIQVDMNRFTNHKCQLLDTDWRELSFVSVTTFGDVANLPPRPAKLDEMLDIARKLSADFPFVRVDLYLADGHIYFGELTFTPGSGIVKHEPESAEIELGKLIDLEAYRATA